jgi:hypothetical protein
MKYEAEFRKEDQLDILEAISKILNPILIKDLCPDEIP